MALYLSLLAESSIYDLGGAKGLLEEVEQHVAVAKRALLEARRVKSESLWS
jgi:hypothetical protein